MSKISDYRDKAKEILYDESRNSSPLSSDVTMTALHLFLEDFLDEIKEKLTLPLDKYGNLKIRIAVDDTKPSSFGGSIGH